MIVEFAGLPGSGKSYLAHALAKAFAASGLQASEPGRHVARIAVPLRLAAKFVITAAWALGRPRRAAALFAAFNGIKGGAVARLKLVVACALPLHWYARRSARDQVVIMDQGSVQALASAAFRNDPSGLEGLAALLPAPDILVTVAAAEGTITARLAAGRSGGLSRAEDPAGRAAYARALDWALAVPGGPGVRAARQVELVNEGIGVAEAALAPLVRSIHEACS